jgi:hypothetical protein
VSINYAIRDRTSARKICDEGRGNREGRIVNSKAAKSLEIDRGIMSIATELATRICDLQYGDLPAQAVNSAKIAILDTLGVALAGSREEATTIVQRTVHSGANGPCLIYGGNHRTNCLDAALINGIAAHVLDFDDCSNTLGGHPSAPILPGLLALAERKCCLPTLLDLKLKLELLAA